MERSQVVRLCDLEEEEAQEHEAEEEEPQLVQTALHLQLPPPHHPWTCKQHARRLMTAGRPGEDRGRQVPKHAAGRRTEYRRGRHVTGVIIAVLVTMVQQGREHRIVMDRMGATPLLIPRGGARSED